MKIDGLAPRVFSEHEQSFVFDNPDDEARICLECLLKTCKSPGVCKRFKEERKKVRERRKMLRKKGNIKVI